MFRQQPPMFSGRAMRQPEYIPAPAQAYPPVMPTYPPAREGIPQSTAAMEAAIVQNQQFLRENVLLQQQIASMQQAQFMQLDAYNQRANYFAQQMIRNEQGGRRGGFFSRLFGR